jgi:hypothetical protein
VTDQVAALRESVARLVAEGRREGIEPEGPLGRWLAAQAGALESLAFVLEGQTARFEAVLADADHALKAEMRRAAAVLEQGQKALSQGEVVLAQARSAQFHLHLSQEALVSRLVEETLPLFAQHMKDVLVIRERRWNADRGRQRMALAGAIAIGVFLAGFVVRTWVDWRWLAIMDHCALHATTEGGHLICDLTASSGL